jgi:hypothetical protein
MFRCERCGSRYSAMHAVAIENCPRCQIRDGIAAPLAFKPFRFPESGETKPRSLPLAATAAQAGEKRLESTSQVLD